MSVSSCEDDQVDPNDTLKSHKRKVAIIMGYLGTAYQGMQVNKSAKTIEGTLFEALCKGNFVSPANSSDQKKISLMRSCRTDKGVHAAMQVVSAKLVIPQLDSLTTTYDHMILTLEESLPMDIRIYGIQRTSNSFHAKNHCDSRVYEYVLPTYILALQHTGKLSYVGQSAESIDSSQENELIYPESNSNKKRSEGVRMDCDDSFRLSEEALNRLRAILHSFEGSWSFHNYTVGKTTTDPSTRRVIKSFHSSDPFLQHDHCCSLEWIRLVIHGQSFMMHQIRKMIGMLILLMRTSSDQEYHKDVIIKTLSPDQKYNIPKAPGFGLLLQETCFDSYNRKFSGKNQQLSLTAYKSKVSDFKLKFIYPEIFKQENDGHLFSKWWTGITIHPPNVVKLLSVA